MKKIFLHFIILIAFAYCVAAQTDDDIDSQLLIIPSLTEIIDVAFIHSPLLKAKTKAIEVIGEETKIERKRWMDHIYFEGATNYGVFDHLIISGQTSNNDYNTGILTKDEQVRYYGGIRLKLPLSAISSSSNYVKVKRLKEEQVGYELLQLQEDLKLIIIEEYYQLLYLRESMHSCNRINQTLEVSYLKAEKDLLNGHMEIGEFALLASTSGKAKNDYLKAKNDFYSQYTRLQTITGTNLKPKI
jgi:outer membrane protein TolC